MTPTQRKKHMRDFKFKYKNILSPEEYLISRRREYLIISRDMRNRTQRRRYKKDMLYKLKHKLRVMLTDIKKHYSLKTESILGCSFKEFQIYLESKFDKWMKWSNQGLYNGEFNYGWDIDHIIPLSSAKNKEELIKLNHYSNLQPLCSKINRDIKKGNYENSNTRKAKPNRVS